MITLDKKNKIQKLQPFPPSKDFFVYDLSTETIIDQGETLDHSSESQNHEFQIFAFVI